MLARAQESFRKDLPGFDAGKLLGASLESMTREPAVLRGVIESLTDIATRQEVIGGRTMKTIMSPMKDDTGRRLGTVLEWFDRTQEVATESELQDVIAAVTAGNLDNRISLDGKRDFFLTLSRGINELVDAIATVVVEVRGVVAAANQGDLTRRIDTQGKAGLLVQIGSGINDLTSNLSALVSQVKTASAEVSRGADEISQGNANLSQRTEEQASSLEETASSMEEMTSTVKQNADNAAQANQLAIAAREQAEKGGAVVSKAVDRHGRHQRRLEEDRRHHRRDRRHRVPDQPAGAERRGGSRARRRAGPRLRRGRHRSAQPRGPLGDGRQGDQGADPGQREQGGRGLEAGDESGATLEEIVSAVKKVTDIVAEIAAASNEQSAGIEQVNKAVMQMDELTQQNAALVEQASAASQAMAEQARDLNNSMERYQVNVAASGAAAPNSTVPAAADSLGRSPQGGQAVGQRIGSRLPRRPRLVHPRASPTAPRTRSGRSSEQSVRGSANCR